MATVYSLVCWGGKDGRTVAAATTDIFTLTNNGLRPGTGVVPQTTTGGVVSGTTYYASPITISTFYLYDTYANAIAAGTTGRIDITSTISGLVLKGAYFLALTTEQKARYGTSGSERIFQGMQSWITSSAAALVATPAPNDDYVLECCEPFDDIDGSSVAIALNCGSILVTTRMGASRSAGWHGGNPAQGYVKKFTSQGLFANSYYVDIDGINVSVLANNATAFSMGSLACFVNVYNCILQGSTSATTQRGTAFGTPGSFHHNIIVNIGGNGIVIPVYGGLGAKIYNNLVTKCTGVGFNQEGSTQCLTYNNISVGNGTNWGSWPGYQPAPRHSNNYGEPADKKAIGINYTVNVNNITLSTHGRVYALPITFSSSGTLPTVVATGQPLVAGRVYYIRTVVDVNVFTISATVGGTVLAFSDNGTGTHYTTAIWSNDGTEKYIDISTPNNVFSDYANNNFYPAGTGGTPNAGATQVNTGMVVAGGVALDMLGTVVPNYITGSDSWDGGPFEFDHLNGLAPLTVTITISAPAPLSGAEIRIYDLDNSPAGSLGTELSGTESHGSATYDYTGLAGNSIWIQIMQTGYEEFGQQLTLPQSSGSFYATMKQDLNI